MREVEDLDSEELAQHEAWMRIALEAAREAGDQGEVPIGAIVVLDGEVIGRGYNTREQHRNATHHAELRAIDEANRHVDAWRLEGATLYVTLEPCPMCAGALINSRVQTVVYGASDPKAGCCGTLLNLVEDERFNHQTEVIRGVLASECGKVLQDFFRGLRERNRRKRQVLQETAVDDLSTSHPNGRLDK